MIFSSIQATFAAYLLIWIVFAAAPISRPIVRTQIALLRPSLTFRVPSGMAAGAVLVLANVGSLVALDERAYGGWRGAELGPLLLTLGYTLTVAATEELIVRGVMLERLRTRCTEAVAVLVTAIVFAIMHAGRRDFATTTAMQYLADGLLLGWAATRTGSIWFGVGWHWAKNLAVALAFGLSKGIMEPVVALPLVAGRAGGRADVVAYALALPLAIVLVRARPTARDLRS